MDALLALLQNDPNSANAFGALASAAAAFLALFVSTVSIWLSVRTAKAQEIHNALTVRPLAEITVANYENSLRVRLHNNGTGPLIIKDITVSDGHDARPSLIEWMPKLPNGRMWNNYSMNFSGRSLAVGTHLTLIDLTEGKDEVNYAACRDRVRAALAPLAVNVEYFDIYGHTMPPVRKRLEWFAPKK